MFIRVISYCLFIFLSSFSASSKASNNDEPLIKWTALNQVDLYSANNQEQLIDGNITIKGKHAVTVFISKNSWLLVNKSTGNTDKPIRYQASVSAGVAYQLSAKKVATAKELISPESKNRLLTLFNDSVKDVAVVLFSGQENEAPQWHDKKAINAENLSSSELIQQPLKQSQHFSHVKAKQKGEYLVKGPTLLKVTSLVANSSTHTKKIAWHINATLNGQSLANWSHKAAINRQYFYTIEDAPTWTTAQQSYYLKIPKGEQKLILSSSSSHWLKVEEIAYDFLLPSNKHYLMTDEQTAIEQIFLQQAKEQFALKLLTKPLWLEDPKSTLDNLSTTLYQHEAAQAIRSFTDLFFKELPPKPSQVIETIYQDSAALFWQPNSPQGEANAEIQFIATNAVQDSQSTNDSQSFFKLTKQQAMTFELPKDRLLADIKVKIYNPNNLSELLQISSDHNSFTAYLQPDSFNDWPVSQNLKDVLPQLRSNEQLKEIEFTGGIAKQKHSEIIFKANDNDSSITISSATKQALYVSVSYIAPQKTTNSQPQWLTLFRGANPPDLLSKQNDAINIEVTRLHQLITQRSEQFIHGLQCEPIKQQATTIVSNKDWRVKAEQLFSKDLSEELANLLFNVTQDNNDITLWQWRLKLLKDNGHWLNYAQILKGLSCDKRNFEVQQYAQKTYAEYTLKSKDHMAYEQLLAFKLSTQSHRPKELENVLYEFALVLFNQGKYRASLASLTLLPLSDKTAQLSLWLAHKLSYWQLYQYLLNYIDTKHVDFYLGLQAFAQTNYSKAIGLWQLNKADLLVTKIVAKTNVARNTATLFPGVIVPEKPDTTSIAKLSAKSIITAYTAAIPSGFNLIHASKKQALNISVKGPLTLKLATRQLKTAEQSLEDDWLLVIINGKTQYIPLNKSAYTSNLKLKGSDLRLGKQYNSEFHLPAGQHQLSITPQHNDVLVAVSSLTSLLPELHLPNKRSPCIASQQWKLVNAQGQLVDSCLLQTRNNKTISPNNARIETTVKADAVNSLSEKVFLWENSGKKNDSALANIQAAILTNQSNHLYGLLNSRMSHSASWHLLRPTLSAGNKVLQSKPLTFQSPTAMINAISKNYDASVDKGKLFKSFETLYFDLKIADNEQVKLRIRSYMSPYIALPNTHLNIKINNRVQVPITLKQRAKTDIKVNLKPSDNHIALNLSQAYGQQFFTVEVLVKSKGKAWRSINNIAKRKVHLTAVNNELSFYLSKASLLRIDSFNKNNEITSRYHYQSKPGPFTIKANKESLKFGYRVYQMNKTDEDKIIGDLYQFPTVKDNTVLSSLYMLDPRQEQLKPAELALGLSPDSDTWGGYYQWRKRINFDEGLSAQYERFNEVGFQQRNFNEEKQRFWRFDVLARLHDSGHKVLAMKHYFDWRLNDSNQLIHTNISTFYQLEKAKQAANWSALLNIGWRRNDDWLARLDNQLTVSIFAQRVANLPINRQYWDNDVYTSDKDEHENGAIISNRLRFTPYQDVELAVLLDAISNPSYQSASLDSASILLFGKLYWRGLTITSSYNKEYFFADNDRLTDENTARWSLGLQHRFWQQQGQLWRLHSNFSYDVANQETSLNLGISWNATHNKGVSDFRLKEVPFRDLYQQQAKNSIALTKVVAK